MGAILKAGVDFGPFRAGLLTTYTAITLLTRGTNMTFELHQQAILDAHDIELTKWLSASTI